jgi:hypothetical protein
MECKLIFIQRINQPKLLIIAIAITLSFLGYFSCIGQSQDSLLLDLKYEQFDSEIFMYSLIGNASSRPKAFSYRFSTSSKDFSGNEINYSKTGRLLMPAQKQKKVNLSSIEYSVLSESDAILQVFDGNRLVATDTLHFNFPNKFRNINTEGGPRDVEIDLGGLKIDQTRTPFGRQFYEKFESIWESPLGISDYTIRFEEIPFRFRTTIIKVYLDSELILETYLNNNEEFTDRLLAYLTATIKQKLDSRKNRDDELGGNWNGI